MKHKANRCKKTQRLVIIEPSIQACEFMNDFISRKQSWKFTCVHEQSISERAMGEDAGKFFKMVFGVDVLSLLAMTFNADKTT